MKKLFYIIAILAIGITLSAIFALQKDPKVSIQKTILGPSVEIPDTNSDFGKALVLASRKQMGVVTQYDTSYFADGKIPENSGVCADVVWRALKEMNYDLRAKLDEDVRKNPADYANVNKPDSAIDFRRVKNLKVFFDKYTERITTEVIPGNIENLSTWQAGDLVTFDPLPTNHLTHIAIISDKRRSDGLPLLIHNYGLGTVETDYLTNWPTKITGHYRISTSTP